MKPIQKEIPGEMPMHRQRFSLPHLSPIVLLGLLVFFVPLAWTQRILTKQTSIQLPDHPVPLMAFPEAKIWLVPSYGEMPLSFTPNLSQTQSGPGFSSSGPDYHLLSLTNKLLLGLDSKADYSNGNASQKWQTNVPTHTHYQSVYFRDLQYYGHRVPLVGPPILHILKQADSHPRATRVLQLL
jgi:hypothetical protein